MRVAVLSLIVAFIFLIALLLSNPSGVAMDATIDSIGLFAGIYCIMHFWGVR